VIKIQRCSDALDGLESSVSDLEDFVDVLVGDGDMAQRKSPVDTQKQVPSFDPFWKGLPNRLGVVSNHVVDLTDRLENSLFRMPDGPDKCLAEKGLKKVEEPATQLRAVEMALDDLMQVVTTVFVGFAMSLKGDNIKRVIDDVRSIKDGQEIQEEEHRNFDELWTKLPDDLLKVSTLITTTRQDLEDVIWGNPDEDDDFEEVVKCVK